MSLEHKEPDRVAIQDSLWKATIERWKKEGLPEGISAGEYFGFEMVQFGADTTPRFPVKTLERTEQYITRTTSYGGVRKNFRDYTSTPEIIDYPVKTKKDWERIKKRLEPDFTRVDWASGLRECQTAREEGKFVTYDSATGYDLFQSYISSEELLIFMVTEPEWVKEMFHTHAELVIEMSKMMIKNGFKFDGAFIYNDMGYRNTSLFSPKTYCDILLETDKMLFKFFHENNMPVILHSCGNVKVLILFHLADLFLCLLFVPHPK